MIVGAYAVFVHGEPRFSADIDIALPLPRSERDGVRARLASTDLRVEEWVADEDGARWVCVDREGIPVELFLGGDSDVQRQEYARRVTREHWGALLPYISPEDLVLRKLVNTRRRRGPDFLDAVGIIRVQGERLDRQYIRDRCAVYRVCYALDKALRAAQSPSLS